MPSQRLFDRFEIITRISSGLLQVFLARERTSGNDALLREFHVDGCSWTEKDLAEKAKAKLTDLEPGIDLEHFADAALSDDKRKAWVVTWVVKDVAVEPAIAPPANLETPSMQPEPAPAPTPVETATTATPASSGEFTRMFTPPARHIQTAEPISLVGATAPPPEAVRVVAPPSAKPMDSGEFTRLFGTPVANPETSALPAVAPTASSETPKSAPSKADLPASMEAKKTNAENIFEAFAQRGPAKSQPAAAKPSPFPPAPPAGPKHEQPGSFTQAFGSAQKAPIGEPHAAESAPTTEFGNPMPPTAPPPPSMPTAPAKIAGAGDFTNIFGSAPQAPIGEPLAAKPKPLNDPFSAALKAAPAKQDQPGAFTQLFNGPKLSAPEPSLKGPGQLRTPAMECRNPASTEPPATKSVPGEFTQMFRNAQPPNATPTGNIPQTAQASTPVFPSTRPEPGPGDLTQLFTMKTPASREPLKADPFADFGPTATPLGSPESLTQILSRTSAPANTAVPGASPAPPPQRNMPYSPANPIIAQEATVKGATHIFSQPKPAAPPPPSGPGEYTRIIAAPRFPAEPATPPVAPPAASGGLSFSGGLMPQVSGPQISGPQFSGPQVSGPQMSGPQLSGPQMSAPQFSGPYVQPPSVQAPYVQMPQMSAPTFQAPAPAAPPATAPAEKKGFAGYLPLIIIFNVLLILAIALVLYFALRHH